MTTKEQSLEGLIERVKAATGPDQELDWRIDVALGLGYDPFTRLRFTASIDAALALVERVLPGWRYDLHSPRMGQVWEAVLMDGDSASRRIVVGHAATAPLAILAATLSALKDASE